MIYQRCAMSKLLICGLEDAGKTTILYKIKYGDVITTNPTFGVNVETVEYNNISFTMWDFEGKDMKAWKTHVTDCAGIVFVVDASNHACFDKAKGALFETLKHDHLGTTPLLLLANKMDEKNSMTVEDVKDKLNLSWMMNGSYRIQPSSATSGAGLREGIEWLFNKILNRG